MFRALKADEIDVRVGTIGEGFATLLLYKDARVDMNILDETLGSENWQRDHKEIKGNLFGGVGIWSEDKSEWIWKWDCGTESNTEKEKGEASDSFKRACTNAGIGRELYSSPNVKVKCETIKYNDNYGNERHKLKDKWQFYGTFVSKIEYIEDIRRTISDLEICDSKGNVIYSMKPKPKQKKLTPEEVSTLEKPTRGGLDFLIGLAKEKGSNIESIKKHYGIKSLDEMTMPQFNDCLEKLKLKEVNNEENKQ